MTRTVERKPITQAMQLALWKEYGQVVCAGCGDTVDDWNMNWDHWLAIVDGGAHEVSNLRPICLPCHKEKSASEHKNNAKAKRLAAAREAHQRGEKKASRLRSRGFDKTRTRTFSGAVVPRKLKHTPEGAR